MMNEKHGNTAPPRVNITETIISRSNPTVEKTVKLDKKKFRDDNKLFLLDGIKLALEAASAGLHIEYILLAQYAEAEYLPVLTSAAPDTRIYVLSEPAFSRVTDEKSPQGVVTAVSYSDKIKRESDAADTEFLCRATLLLDGIQNPDNLGAILRSARAFGCRDIICGGGCADIYGRKVMRASMGAALTAGTLYIDDTAAACRAMRAAGKRVIAACPTKDAASLYKFSYKSGDCVIIGNEGHGISDAILALATDTVYIPMTEGAESLNAACAASVLLWERYRQSAEA